MTQSEILIPVKTEDKKEVIVDLLSTFVNSDTKRINNELLLKIL